MSATTTTTPPPVNEVKTPQGILSIYSQTLVLAGLAVAIYTKNENAFMMVLGAIIANGNTVVQYYMGSSKGSASKDATIASQLPTPPVPPGSTTIVTTPATQTVTTAPRPATTTSVVTGLAGIPTTPTGTTTGGTVTP